MDVNPITLLVTAMRGLIHGGDVTTEIAIVLAIAAGLTAVFGPLAIRAYRRHD